MRKGLSVVDRMQPGDVERTAELVSALDSPLRLQILLLLNDSPHVVHQIVGKLDKSQPLVSQHLRVLKRCALVDATRSGREVVYALTQPEVIDVIHELADISATAAESAEAAGSTEDELDELAFRRRGRNERNSGSGAAAIIDPPADVRPDQDPGLTPKTPGPVRE